MYCRQQRYPSPRLISYKITGIRVLWGFGVTLSEVSTIGCARSFLRVILCPSDSHPTQPDPLTPSNHEHHHSSHHQRQHC